jgi:hypothetical protein
MLRPAWISRVSAILQRPTALLGVVLLVGTALWWFGGRREQVVEHQAVAHVPVEEAIKAADIEGEPPVLTEARRLPSRIGSVPMTARDRSIRAHFETATPQEDQAVQGAGFSAQVTANSPAWLTGTIEVE